MSARIVPKLALRQSRWAIQRRAASTTSEAANAASSGATKAKEATQDTVGKAQQGLSRVTSSAGSAVSGAANSIGKTLSGVGGRTGQVIGFVNSMIPPTIYYAKVATELGKIAVKGRNMQPPTMQTVQTYLQPITKNLSNPQAMFQRSGNAAEKTADAAINNPQSFVTRLRNMDTATLQQVGIVSAEVLGFFTVGEMIGRFKIVGYRSDAPHGAH